MDAAAGFTWRSEGGYFINMNANYQIAAFPRANQTQSERAIDS